MKKALSLILALALCLSLCACGHTHEFGEWTVKADATCTNDGARERVCECGEIETEVIAAAGHSYGEAVEVRAVSCTEDGQTEKSCTICGDTVTETVSAAGHTFTAATAFAPKTCTTCGATEGEALAKVVNVGDVVEAEDHSFVVESVEFTSSLSEKRGNVTYNHSSDFALAIKLDFTNLATENFERWNSDRMSEVSMEYMGKYQYEGDYWVPVDDIVPLANDTFYIVYEVPESMSEDASGSILATFTIDGETYAMVVQEGDGTGEATQSTGASADVSGTITVGDVLTNDTTFSFEVADLYYTDEPSYKTGNVTYTFGNDGYYLACKLDFTNMSAETLDGWNSDRITDMNLTFADKYAYEGTVWIPDHEIVPLDNGYVFVLFQIPETVETSTDALVMTFTVDDSEFTMICR